MHDHYEQIYRKISALKDYEPVPGDFQFKKTGMEALDRLLSIKDVEMALEVGCGSGANSAFLSCMARQVVSTDLPYYNSVTHSLGMSVAKGLLSKLDIDNVKLVSCSGEGLPFIDNTFDFVYSASVMEHIENKERALSEMLRVARPGGIVVFIVPTYVQSFFAFLHLYLYTGKRILEVVYTKVFGKPINKDKMLLPKADDGSRTGSAIVNSFRKSHPSFPLPEPHGSYKNIFQEFNRQLPWKWTGLAKKCGAHSVDSFAFLFLPFNVMEVFSTRMIAWLYSHTKSLHCLAAKSPLKYFSYSYCVVAKK